MSNVTELLQRLNLGDEGARSELFAATYPELRKLARLRLRHGGRNTFLATTALVHESYLRFLHRGRFRVEDRRAFFVYASGVMRSVIVDAVRERRAERRGGGAADVTLNADDPESDRSVGAEILQVNDVLLALEATDPRLTKVVEMRYFGGYTDEEIGEALGIHERTVRRDWDKARLLMLVALQS